MEELIDEECKAENKLMISEDYLVRIMAKEAGIRGLACVTTDTANESTRRHNTFSTAGAVLASGLTSAALLGALLNIKQRIAIKFQGNGPVQKCIAESDAYGRVRGYVAVPEVELPRHFGRPDIARAMGNEGLLTVVKDLGNKGMHEGVVALVDGSIEQDVLHYLTRSEQVQSLIDIDGIVSDNPMAEDQIVASGGMLLQALPGVDEKKFDNLSARFDELPSVAQELNHGRTLEELLAHVMAGIEYETLEKRSVHFSCSCSWKRTEKALLILGRAELESLMAEGEATVDCHFCGEQYIFGQEALETIIDKL
ncbi:MAG: Hsp33 family molecular chaperone HslO [Chloroflexota bacterium]